MSIASKRLNFDYSLISAKSFTNSGTVAPRTLSDTINSKFDQQAIIQSPANF